MSTALFNEIDPYATQWIRNLAAAGHVAPGRVDERSIKEITATELAGVVQFHTFAGIAIWSYALRAAGWPDSEEVWSGSCPCQPFSDAGAGKGFEDERHLWPDWFKLIDQRRPAVVFGEQVASKDGLAWLDAVRADLEGAGYAFGVLDSCAAGYGAPHIRQRLYFVGIRPDRLAHHHQQGLGQLGRQLPEDADAQSGSHVDGRGEPGGLADHGSEGRIEVRTHAGRSGGGGGEEGVDQRSLYSGVRCAPSGGVGHADGEHPWGHAGASDPAEGRAELRSGTNQPCPSGPAGRLGFAGFEGLERHTGDGNASGESRRVGEEPARPASATGPTNGFWSDVEWLACRDGKARPTQPGLFPLADGAPERVGADGALETQPRAQALKAYGNGLVGEQAVEFVKAVMLFLGMEVRGG